MKDLLMKEFFSKVWERIKKHKKAIVLYVVMVLVSVVSDIFFGGFNIFKYIVYGILMIIAFIVMIKYKDKITEIVDKVEDKVDENLNK